MQTRIGTLQCHRCYVEASSSLKYTYGRAFLVANPGFLVVEGTHEALIADPAHRHERACDLRDLEAGAQRACLAVNSGQQVEVDLAHIGNFRAVPHDEVQFSTAAWGLAH